MKKSILNGLAQIEMERFIFGSDYVIYLPKNFLKVQISN